MALRKIELKLGKKVITLTPEQFEELKQDMRNLDKDHHYYWHNYQHYHSYPSWNRTQGVILCDDISTGNTIGIKGTAGISFTETKPPAFSGSILSTA